MDKAKDAKTRQEAAIGTEQLQELVLSKMDTKLQIPRDFETTIKIGEKTYSVTAREGTGENAGDIEIVLTSGEDPEICYALSGQLKIKGARLESNELEEPTPPVGGLEISVGDSITMLTSSISQPSSDTFFAILCGEEDGWAISYGNNSSLNGYFDEDDKVLFLEGPSGKCEYIFNTSTYNGRTYNPGWYAKDQSDIIPTGVPSIEGLEVIEIYDDPSFETPVSSITVLNNWFTVAQ